MGGAGLEVSEVFYSIQGEGTRSGMPCAFVRLAGCELRCRYCDTAYAWSDGVRRGVDDLIAEVDAFGCNLVQITGGEPLLQPGVHRLMTRLCDLGKAVLLETSGAYDISTCDRRVVRIMDLKTPGSGESERNLWSNIELLTAADEVKFVLCDRVDYDWACRVIRRYNLAAKVAAVLMGCAWSTASVAGAAASQPLPDLAEWILADRLPVRLHVQLHKLIWGPDGRGVENPPPPVPSP